MASLARFTSGKNESRTIFTNHENKQISYLSHAGKSALNDKQKLHVPGYGSRIITYGPIEPWSHYFLGGGWVGVGSLLSGGLLISGLTSGQIFFTLLSGGCY